MSSTEPALSAASADRAVHVALSSSESLRRLRTLVSSYTGLVHSIGPTLSMPDDTRLLQISSVIADTDALIGQSLDKGGAGAAPSRDAAFAAAVGETVERYAACYTDEADALVTTATAVGPEAVDPTRFALFSAAQYADPGFPYAPFTRNTPVAWVRGFSLPDGKPALLPAQLVYLGWRLQGGEERIAGSTSNGLACHETFEEAAATGLLELLERDAFMITWKARLALPRLVWHGDEALERFARRYLAPSRLSFSAVDLSRIWEVPTALAVVRSSVPGEAPLGIGACSSRTIQEAVWRALDEAFRVRSWARALRLLDPDGRRTPDPNDIRTFEHHIAYYARPEHADRTRFLDQSDVETNVRYVPPLDEIAAADVVGAICARLRARGSSAYAVDVTSPDIRAAGLHVVKVVAPELCALDVEHRAQLLGGARLYEEPVRLGLRTERLDFHSLNPDPHPFP
jgi:ribosomal protein S12 methylthiotransferase accessory factor